MRKLASIQKVIDIQPISGADAIEVITVLGWKIVTKKGTFSIGDLCVYFEIDSLLPELPQFEFLRGSSWKEKLNAYRLKTIKLRGQISQGLALPISDFYEYLTLEQCEEGMDVTETLKVDKYEPPVTDGGDGQSKSYNWEIPKTDETRVQSDPTLITNMLGQPYYISVKLDGTSTTYILSRNRDNELEFNVCGRNICLSEYIEHTKENGEITRTLNEGKYWDIARRYNIKEQMFDFYNSENIRLAFQGELIGNGIQGNKMNLTDKDFYVFNVWANDEKDNTTDWVKLDIDTSLEVVEHFGLKFVPIIERDNSFNYNSVDELLEKAKGDYKEYFENAKHNQPQEGIVVRTQDSRQSFKVINNDFLLKGGE